MKRISMRGVIYSVFVVGALSGTTTPAFSGVTYTCDPHIDAKVAGTRAYLNSTITGLYSKTFSNANVSIYIQYGSADLGNSFTSQAVLTYSEYLTALTANAQASGNPVQVAAVKALNSLHTALYGSDSVEIPSAHAAALGFTGLSGLNSTGLTFCNRGTTGCY